MTEVSQEKTSMTRKWMVRLSIFAVAMFGFGYALVPIYDLMCKELGINGKTGGPVLAAKSTQVDKSRTITVQFLTTQNAKLGKHWEFYPKITSIEVHPGENKQVNFIAKNDTNAKMTVQAIPSVTPSLAAKYLKKTECFCFEQQTLTAHEKADMPLVFHVDRDIPKEYHTITLSYTLFNANKFAKDKKS